MSIWPRNLQLVDLLVNYVPRVAAGLRYTKDVFTFAQRDVCWMCEEWTEVGECICFDRHTAHCVCTGQVRVAPRTNNHGLSRDACRPGQNAKVRSNISFSDSASRLHPQAVMSHHRGSALIIAHVDPIACSPSNRKVFLHLKFEGFEPRPMERSLRQLPRMWLWPPTLASESNRACAWNDISYERVNWLLHRWRCVNNAID